MSSDDVAMRNYLRVNQIPPPAGPAAPLSQFAMDFVFGRLWDSPGLTWRERRVCSLTCTAISGQSIPLEAHVRGAIKSGDFSADDMRALSVHVAAYAGFPIGTAIEMTLQKILAEK